MKYQNWKKKKVYITITKKKIKLKKLLLRQIIFVTDVKNILSPR